MTNHDELRVLLPWFVNGTLAEREHSRVDAHIANCDACQNDIEELVQMSAEFTPSNLDDDLNKKFVTSSDQFAELLEATDAPIAKHRSRFGLTITALASIVVLVSLAIVVSLPFKDEFRTLSENSISNADSAVIQVVFSPETTEKTIREVLLENGNEVLSGPSRQGVYRVQLAPEQDGRIYLARLKHHDDVIFAEREER